MTDAQMAASLTPWEFCLRLEQLGKVWIVGNIKSWALEAQESAQYILHSI